MEQDEDDEFAEIDWRDEPDDTKAEVTTPSAGEKRNRDEVGAEVEDEQGMKNPYMTVEYSANLFQTSSVVDLDLHFGRSDSRRPRNTNTHGGGPTTLNGRMILEASASDDQLTPWFYLQQLRLKDLDFTSNPKSYTNDELGDPGYCLYR